MSLSPPRGMSLEARQVCRKLAPELEYEGTLTPANRGDFAQYCVEVLATLPGGGPGQRERRRARARSASREFRQHAHRALELTRQFGLTPLSAAERGSGPFTDKERRELGRAASGKPPKSLGE